MSTLQQQARTLIDFLGTPTVRKTVGDADCLALIGNLQMHIDGCTAEENEPRLAEDVAATQRIIRLSMMANAK